LEKVTKDIKDNGQRHPPPLNGVYVSEEFTRTNIMKNPNETGCGNHVRRD